MGREMTQAGGKDDLGRKRNLGQWWDVLAEGEQRGHLRPQGALSLMKGRIGEAQQPRDL